MSVRLSLVGAINLCHLLWTLLLHQLPYNQPNLLLSSSPGASIAAAAGLTAAATQQRRETDCFVVPAIAGAAAGAGAAYAYQEQYVLSFYL